MERSPGKTGISSYSGRIITFTGVLHILVMIPLYGDSYLEMIRDGLFNTVDSAVRAAATWTFMIGVLLICWGETLQHYQNRTHKPAPLFVGYAMLLFSVIGCIIMPLSGFWLFLPQAIIIIVANKKDDMTKD